MAWYDGLLHISDTPFCRNVIIYRFQFSGTHYLEESKITLFLSSEDISNADMLCNSLWKRGGFGKENLTKLVLQEMPWMAAMKA